VEDAVGGCEEVDAALGGTACPEVGTPDSRREAERGLILVDVALLEDEDRDAVCGDGTRVRGKSLQVGPGQAAALRPALTADSQIARRYGPGKAGIRARARPDSLDSQRSPFVRPTRRRPVAERCRARAAN
jgi:hypothetical protein